MQTTNRFIAKNIVKDYFTWYEEKMYRGGDLNDYLESVRVFVVAVLLFTMLRTQKQSKHFPHNGWSHILIGFGLLLFGSIIGITDNFASLSRYVVIGDTQIQTFLENVVGFIGGFIFITIGVQKWLPFVAGVEELGEMAGRLAVSKEKLERQNATLFANEERFRAIFNSSTSGMATLTPEGYFEKVNLAYQNILGYNANELAGLRWQDLASEEDREASKKMLKEVGDGSLERGVLRRKYWKKDGAILPCTDRLSAICHGEGEPVSYYILIMDEIED